MTKFTNRHLELLWGLHFY